MAAYHIKAKAGTVIVDGKLVAVDSQNEARLIAWLEQSGFSGLWQRSNLGATIGQSRYTNDFELSVLHECRSQRAIVEAKPYRSALTANIIRRMQGTASFYKTDLLLLYARRENAWYRIDARTGSLTPYGQPTPGSVPLNKLPKAISLTSEKRGGRYYQRRFNPLGWLADVVIGVLQGPKDGGRGRRKGGGRRRR